MCTSHTGSAAWDAWSGLLLGLLPASHLLHASAVLAASSVPKPSTRFCRLAQRKGSGGFRTGNANLCVPHLFAPGHRMHCTPLQGMQCLSMRRSFPLQRQQQMVFMKGGKDNMQWQQANGCVRCSPVVVSEEFQVCIAEQENSAQGGWVSSCLSRQYVLPYVLCCLHQTLSFSIHQAL